MLYIRLIYTPIKPTLSSLRCVDADDNEDLLDIVDDDPDTFGKSIDPLLRGTSSSACIGIDALRRLMCLFFGNNKLWFGVDEEVISMALEDDESTLSLHARHVGG